MSVEVLLFLVGFLGFMCLGLLMFLYFAWRQIKKLRTDVQGAWDTNHNNMKLADREYRTLARRHDRLQKEFMDLRDQSGLDEDVDKAVESIQEAFLHREKP